MSNLKDEYSVLHYSRRVILFGCRIEGSRVFAGIAYFDRGLSTKLCTMSDFRSKEKLFKVKTPEMFLNQQNRGRAQNIWLDITQVLE